MLTEEDKKYIEEVVKLYGAIAVSAIGEFVIGLYNDIVVKKKNEVIVPPAKIYKDLIEQVIEKKD